MGRFSLNSNRHHHMQNTCIVRYLHVLNYITGLTPTFETVIFIKRPPFVSRRWYLLFTEDLTKVNQTLRDYQPEKCVCLFCACFMCLYVHVCACV